MSWCRTYHPIYNIVQPSGASVPPDPTIPASQAAKRGDSVARWVSILSLSRPSRSKKPRMAKSIVQTCQIVKEKHVYVKYDISMTCSLTHTMIYGTISRRSKKRSTRTHRYELSSRNCASVPFIFSRGNRGSANTLPYTLSPGFKSRSLFPLKRNHSHRTHLLRPDQDPPPRRNLPPTAPTLLCHRYLPSLLLPVTRPQRLECFLLQHLPYLQ